MTATTSERQWTSTDRKATVRVRIVDGQIEVTYEDQLIDHETDFFQRITVDKCGSTKLRRVPGGWGEIYGVHATQVLTIERVDEQGRRERLEVFRDPDDERNERSSIGWKIGNLAGSA